jgi:hypothetical protein
MQYKTITLEMIKQRPQLYEQLRASKTLLATMERYAVILKASHEAWMEELSATHPNSDRSQISSEALEHALKVLGQDLDSNSTTEEDELDLDAAMTHIRLHTPTA